MKRVINGLTYNTETATAVADWSNNLGYSDFRHCYETLYRTPKGRFFLEGSGGPMTKWKQPSGNMWTGGEGILALDNQDALAWCEDRGVDADKIAEYFAEQLEDA